MSIKGYTVKGTQLKQLTIESLCLMNNFIDLNLPKTLDTSTADIIKDFFVPVLTHATHYDRGVGFFSAGWLRMTAKGMAAFAQNNGRARWVTSPILSEEDWQSLQLGEMARHSYLLLKALERNLNELESSLEEETLTTLAWLVADGILDFKLALPRNKLKQGEFHDKFGIFTDADGNQISFNGSYNDSIQGTRNYESIKVFCSWQPAFADLVRVDAERFENLWNNQDSNVQVFDLPEAANARILRLRKHERPYPEPDWEKLKLLRESHASYLIHSPKSPRIPPHIKLRDYQTQAVDAWFSAGGQGLFEMATGTGKTITALAASIRLYESGERLVVIIAVPYQHLVDQWYEEATSFGYSPIRAYKNRGSWLTDLNNCILSYNQCAINDLCIITTHSTYSTKHEIAPFLWTKR